MDETANSIPSLLTLAATAPNGHNAQPWHVTIESSTQLVVGSDPEHRDGLTPEALGMGVAGRLMWYGFFSRDNVLKRSFREAAIKKARKQLDACGTLFVITAQDYSAAALFDCADVYQRLLWEATLLGIPNHTMSQVLEEAPWKEALADELGVAGIPQFVVRVGYGRPASPSVRRPLHAFVTDGSE